MKLTRNFTLDEFLKTSHNIYLSPSPAQIKNIKALAVNCIQPLRTFNKAPVYINSGFRSKALNKIVRGSKTSNHLTGCAADIRTISHNKLIKLYYYAIRYLPYNQLIYYNHDIRANQFIHISYKPDGNKRQVLIKEYDEFIPLDVWFKTLFNAGGPCG